VAGWFTDDTPARFEAYGWQVIRHVDGHDPEEIHQAIETARAETARPTLICCRTVIGFGAPNKQGTEATHGAPLGAEEVAAARRTLDWPFPPFEVPEACYEGWNARTRGANAQAEWQQRWASYQQAFPSQAAEYERRMRGELPPGWAQSTSAAISELQANGADKATRQSSLMALNAFGPMLPELIGGSADLAGSNLTIWNQSVDVNEGRGEGNYIYFGVREFGMAAICNGLALHGGFIPYNSTFLVFSDYARNAVRMSALIPTHNIHVYTHDSIGLGEDGPTHQPVEHVASLRLIPNLSVWRPCDSVETAVAWKCAIEERDGPHALVLTRQGLPHQVRSAEALAGIERGGYVLRGTDATPQAVIIATGSEVKLATAAAEALAKQGVAVRVVSMPNPGRFLAQEPGYRDQVLPPGLTVRVAVEAGVTSGWERFTGGQGRIIGLDQFGASAPAGELFEHFGFSAERVAQAVRELLAAV
jgi:transketolase